jgi:ubiquitin carboxyl-terminal hydrolase 22/27/51
MSVILQSFLHNPLLRNYFLSDKHNHQLCGKANCMCCELDQLFEDVFSTTSTTPPPEAPAGTGPALGPVSLLRTTWENSNDIAGNSQQDAHEFFIALLNQIHLGSAGSTHGSSCSCVVHQVFAGKLQSDVKCGKCGHINPTVDPLLDISLELKGIQNGKVTLASCLRRSVLVILRVTGSDSWRRFTEQEKLQPKDYVCGKCQTATAVRDLLPYSQSHLFVGGYQATQYQKASSCTMYSTQGRYSMTNIRMR